MSQYILLRHRETADLHKLEVYRQQDGFQAFHKVVTSMQPDAVTEVVKASGLRGRGGAGFPTGMKWAFVDRKNWPHYVVANADESEPGTFKDREIMERNPFQFLEGVAIALMPSGRMPPMCTCAGSSGSWHTSLTSVSRRCVQPACSGRISSVRIIRCVSTPIWEQVHISVEKRLPC